MLALPRLSELCGERKLAELADELGVGLPVLAGIVTAENPIPGHLLQPLADLLESDTATIALIDEVFHRGPRRISAATPANTAIGAIYRPNIIQRSSITG